MMAKTVKEKGRTPAIRMRKTVIMRRVAFPPNRGCRRNRLTTSSSNTKATGRTMVSARSFLMFSANGDSPLLLQLEYVQHPHYRKVCGGSPIGWRAEKPAFHVL